jgi:hypothetical protein
MPTHYSHHFVCYSTMGSSLLEGNMVGLEMVTKLFALDKNIRTITVTNNSTLASTVYNRPSERVLTFGNAVPAF